MVTNRSDAIGSATKPGVVTNQQVRLAVPRQIPPASYILLSIVSVQFGATLAKRLFPVAGPSGTVLLRVAMGALLLLALWRPRLTRRSWREWRAVLLFGVTLAAMNWSFYNALARVPLGVAVTIEFVGPLGVAIAGSRRVLDILWVLLAASGILLLAPWSGAGWNPTGIVLALVAGGFWALYILLGAHLGRVFPPGGSGLALAMAVAALCILPVGIASAGAVLLSPLVLLAGLGIGLLSSAIPYSLETAALRRVPPRVFGILMSLEPAAGALFGYLILGEHLGIQSLLALVLVSCAALGATAWR